MTVDRLAALEAVAPAARRANESLRLVSRELTDPGTEALAAQWELQQTLDALAAASSLTTPTPDQAALERAREIVDSTEWERFSRDEPYDWVKLIDLIAAALTAAASEARAAERKTVLEIITDVRRRYAPATAASAALNYAAYRIECALATPAEGK